MYKYFYFQFMQNFIQMFMSFFDSKFCCFDKVEAGVLVQFIRNDTLICKYLKKLTRLRYKENLKIHFDHTCWSDRNKKFQFNYISWLCLPFIILVEKLNWWTLRNVTLCICTPFNKLSTCVVSILWQVV